MSYKIALQPNKQIVFVTVASPFDFRRDLGEIAVELHTLLGEINNTVYLIYDIRQLNISFSDIVTGASGFARQTTEFEKQLSKYGRMVLVGTGTLINVSARTVARFSPERPFPVFGTTEEALEYAQTELAKAKS